MLGQPLRRLTSPCAPAAPLRLLLLLLLLAAGAGAASPGCVESQADPDPSAEALDVGRRYVQDPEFRRGVLEGSLVNPDNGYSRLRLARYTEDDWGALPQWKPELAPVLPADPADWTHEALVAAGRQAFFGYPIQVAPALRLASDPDAATKYGVSTALWIEIPDGDETAFSCSTCHARPAGAGGGGEPEGLRAGVTNDRFDYGAMLDDYYVRRTPSGAWGPGRADVTADDVDNPTAITDLRPIRLQTRLHKTASVRNGLAELAVRVETLIITNLGQAVRPPRETALALAWFLRSLADDLPLPPPPGSGPGRQVFDAHCARCHAGDAMTGPPVPLAAIGTDPTVGESPERGTRRYRVPSLRGVGDRRPLLANGAVPDVQSLLDPGRSAPGHPFGLDLSEAERTALLGFLAEL